jgi:hypothetical protein
MRIQKIYQQRTSEFQRHINPRATIVGSVLPRTAGRFCGVGMNLAVHARRSMPDVTGGLV